jgi:hypothetical protein
MIARTTLNERRAPRCAENRLDLDITRYAGGCYYEVVYIQGGNWLNDLRRRMGDDAFWGALRSYLEEHRFQLGSIRELLDTLDAASPVDVRSRAEPFFPSVY